MAPSKRQLLLICLLLAILPVLAGGCSREGRHQVLTIFFTGVRPLDWVPPEEAVGPPPLSAMEKRQLERKRALARRIYTGMYSHGPYVGEACAECHVMAIGGFGFRSGDSSETGKKSIAPGQFILPRGELCVACHADHGNTATQAAGLYSHGPGWNCRICHEPHNSREPYLLKAAANDLCLQCHGAGFIHAAGPQEKSADCLDCHNPHMGRDAMMLRDGEREPF